MDSFPCSYNLLKSDHQEIGKICLVLEVDQKEETK